MSQTAHSIVSPFDVAGQGLAGVLFRARQDRLALQQAADENQASRNMTAVAKASAAMRILGRLVLAFRSEVAALDAENTRLKSELSAEKTRLQGELSRMRSRALEAEGRIIRLQKAGRLAA